MGGKIKPKAGGGEKHHFLRQGDLDGVRHAAAEAVDAQYNPSNIPGVRAGGATSGDDALAMSLSHLTHVPIQWLYLISDLTVLGLSLTYIPLRRIAYSLLTVILSGQIIGWIQRIRFSADSR